MKEVFEVRIIIDLDNTVLDSYAAILKLYEQKTGKKPLPISKTVKESLYTYCPGTTDAEISSWFLTTEFFEIVKPFEGAVETLTTLVEAGYEIVVASLHNQPQEPKQNWVKTHLPFVKEIHLIEFDDHRIIDKSSVSGDIIIDDNVLALESSPAPHKICFNHYKGYNDHWKGQTFNQWGDALLNYLKTLK